MTSWLNKLVADTNGRPFSQAEAERIVEYAESLPERLAAAKKLEDSGKWFTRQFSDAIADRAEAWGLPREPIVADFTANFVHLAHAMILDDVGVLETSLIGPGRLLADALDLPSEDYGELFQTAWQILAKRLEPRPAALLEPYFTHVAEALGTPRQALIETPSPIEV